MTNNEWRQKLGYFIFIFTFLLLFSFARVGLPER